MKEWMNEQTNEWNLTSEETTFEPVMTSCSFNPSTISLGFLKVVANDNCEDSWSAEDVLAWKCVINISMLVTAEGENKEI